MKINFVVAAAALLTTLLSSSIANAQEVSCSGSGGTNCTGTIPDFPIATPFTSTINLVQPFSCSGNAIYRGVGVRVDLTHDHVGDLRISVAGPSGSTTLFDQPAGSAPGGCAGEDIQAVFGSIGAVANSCQEATIPATSGNVLATGPGIAALQAAGVTGAWTLTVTDLSNGSEGLVNDWALTPQCETLAMAVPAQSNTGLLIMFLLVTAMGAWGLANRRRRG